MIFAIFYRSADTCGNEDQYFAGYYEADSLEHAEAEFPRGFLVGFAVKEVTPITAEEIRNLVKQKTDNRFWL